MYEIRFHGLGGEGVVSASEFLGKAAMKEGKWAHSFPFFGTEIRGAAVRAFLRVSDSPISIKSYIYEPDLVMVTNSTILSLAETTDGISEKTLVLINTSRAPSEISGEIGGRIQTINAGEIGYGIFGKPIANTVMVGALLRLTRLLALEPVEDAVREEFSGKMAQLNVQALRAGYDAVGGREGA